MTQAQQWLMLSYTLPREPSAPRVALWRKLKKLGAILLHDALWVLPATPALQEQVRWLATEITEAEGSAEVWHGHLDLLSQDAALVDQFVAQAEAGYQELLHLLNDPLASRTELARRYRQLYTIDYFHAPSSERVRARLEDQDEGEEPCSG
jgi:DNA-binding transcriptional regulator PaaX